MVTLDQLIERGKEHFGSQTTFVGSDGYYQACDGVHVARAAIEQLVQDVITASRLLVEMSERYDRPLPSESWWAGDHDGKEISDGSWMDLVLHIFEPALVGILRHEIPNFDEEEDRRYDEAGRLNGALDSSS